MKILFFALSTEQVASSRTRVFQYIPYLTIESVSCKIYIYNPYLYMKNSFLKNRILFSILINLRVLIFFILSLFYKIVFIQKIYLPRWIVFILSKLNKKIIFDFDDAIYIQDDNSQLPKRILRRFNYILRKASLIITENDNNENYARKYCNNILGITGPIECNRYFPIEIKLPYKKTIIIGWIGSESTTKYLLLIKDAIIRLKNEYRDSISFISIGADENQIKDLPIQNYLWNLNTEVSLLQSFDIGIMPLPDDKWSKGKGGYKLLQYMAIGIPSVASPVGINVKLMGNNCGICATTIENWFEQIAFLIQNSDVRKSIGNSARTIALEKYSYEINTNILINKIAKL